MALNYDLTRINGYKKLWKRQGENLEMKEPYRTIIFCTMMTGIREITEKNRTNFHARVSFIENTRGSFCHKKGKPVYISQEDVDRMIGLRTNASTLTRSQFIKRHTQDLKI